MEKLFLDKSLADFFQKKHDEIRSSVDRIQKGELLGVNPEQIAGTMVSKYRVKLPVIKKEDIGTHIDGRTIPGSDIPQKVGGRIIPTNQYPIDVAVFNVPYEGNSDIFYCYPFGVDVYHPPVERVAKNKIVIEITNWGKIAGNNHIVHEVQQEFLKMINQVEHGLEAMEEEIKDFNDGLSQKILTLIKSRADEVRRRKQNEDDLNPFRRKG